MLPEASRRLVLVWLLVVGTVGGLLLVSQRAGGPLDDPDPALQRPGFLDSVGRPSDAPAVAGLSVPRQRTVVFFVRPRLLDRLCATLGDDASLRAEAEVVVVVSAAVARTCGGVPVVEDPSGELATRLAIRHPRDGGPPVGYAVVDRAGRVRYRTLDPTVADNLDEVETMVRATP